VAKAADIVGLGRAEAERRNLTVCVEGVVTFAAPDRPWFYVQDESAGILVVQSGFLQPLKAGQKVRVTGRTRAGTFAPFVEGESVTMLEESVPLPEPRRATPAEVNTLRYFGQWVETAGVVRDAVYSPVYHGQLALMLAGTQGPCTVVIHGAGPALLTENLREATVTVRGLVWNQYDGQVQVSGMDHVKIEPHEGPGRFERPVSDPAALPAPPVSDEPVHVRGTCLFTDAPGRIHLRAENGPRLLAVPLVLLPRTSATTDALAQPDMQIPAPGDAVELVGMASPEYGHVVVRECQIRVTASGLPLPAAAKATVAAAGLKSAAGQLLTVEGVVIKNEVRHVRSMLFPQRSIAIPVLTIEDGGARIEVAGSPGTEKEFAGFPTDRIAEVTGYQLSQGNLPAQLWVRSKDDVVLRGRSRQAIMQIVWWVLGWLGALVLTAAGFIWALREKLKRQRQEARQKESEAAVLKASELEIRELNASLETRVALRTAELAEANERLRLAGEEMLANLDRERELGELKSNFVSMVSHEFRTPLAVILSSTELLRNHLDRLSPERREQQLHSIHSSTMQMAKLIEEVLLLGKVEAGRMTFEPAPLDLRAFCAQLVDEALSATRRRCRITLTCSPDLPPAVQADAALLRHIFSNLLSNAAKYSPEGSTVTLDADCADGEVVIRVTDHGIGIPRGDLPNLFKPFHRAKNVGQVSGTGLGLMITRRCIELHGGRVTLLSPDGGGTVATVTFPLISGPESSHSVTVLASHE
jgi:signal transduction histidine kinase